MTTFDKAAVENLLKNIIDPHHGLDLVAAKSVKAIAVDGANVSVKLELGYPAKSTIPELEASVMAELKKLPGVGEVNVETTVKIIA
ncbi:MAG: iron-sulfur cluster assembly protein, partial [Gammaproteobacteria bacterium]